MSSFVPRIEVATHYVVEIRVQEVKVSVTTPVSSGLQAVTGVKTSTEREVRELAHYVHSENALEAALTKSAKLLELVGE